MDKLLERRALQTLEIVVEMTPAERLSYLEALGDSALVSRVNKLLEVMERLDAMTDPAHRLEVLPVAADLVGMDVGPYRLEAKIGEGGMGVVYRARRVDGAFQRNVAIKFFSSIAPEVLRRRFNNERQLLARLNHNYIAGLLDAGSVSIGGRLQPYLVMEFVDGVHFDFDADRSQEQTLQMFIKVCEAVHYAHSRLVLHRDLKPGNVLLDAQGQPKLLDFGVAKLLEADDVGSFTQHLPAAFTFSFTAPEVLEGEVASVASDVYALGIYLHVLLKGETPYSFERSSLPVMLQKIRAHQMQIAAPKTELDAILFKATHADPGQRYDSVSALAQDLRRYLSGHPVQAQGDSSWYRAKLFVKRHTLAVGFGVLSALSLSTATGAALHQANLATTAQASAERTLNFIRTMFSAADPRSGEPLGPDAPLQELLLMAQNMARDTFAEDPESQLNIYLLLANTWLNLEQLDQVKTLLTDGQRLFAQHKGALSDSGVYAELLQNLSIALSVQGTRWTEAVAQCDTLPDLAAKQARRYSWVAMQLACANAYVNTGNAEQTKHLAQAARTALEDPYSSQLTRYEQMEGSFNLANVYLGLADFENATTYMELAEEKALSLGETGLTSLALIYVMRSIEPNQTGDKEASLAFTRQALEAAEASPLTPDQVLHAYVQLYHADRLIDLDRVDEAASVFENAREVLLSKTAPSSHYHATTYFTDYKIAFKAQEYERAEQSLLAAKAIRSAGGEAYTSWQAASDFGLGKIYMAQQRRQEAIDHLEKAHQYYAKALGTSHPRTILYWETLQQAQRMAH